MSAFVVAYHGVTDEPRPVNVPIATIEKIAEGPTSDTTTLHYRQGGAVTRAVLYAPMSEVLARLGVLDFGRPRVLVPEATEGRVATGGAGSSGRLGGHFRAID